MTAVVETHAAPVSPLDDEDLWREVLGFLSSYVRQLVHTASIESWQGQQAALVDDIVQETALRLLVHIRRVAAGTASPVRSLKGFAATVARHYCIDLQRHDSRLRRRTPQGGEIIDALEPAEPTDLLAVATEHLCQAELFRCLAQQIAHFPRKQREALLRDLATYTHDAEPSPLQQALLVEGIDLQAHQRPLPADPRGRAQHSALLSVAYKRVAHCICQECEE